MSLRRFVWTVVGVEATIVIINSSISLYYGTFGWWKLFFLLGVFFSCITLLGTLHKIERKMRRG